jgi:hypothetical protein
MRRLLLAGAFAVGGLAVLASGLPAYALAIAMPQQGPERVAQAAVIVLGRVVALEDKDVQIGGQTYRIAAVSVTEPIKGTKEKQVRVGFVPVPQGNDGNPVPIRPGRPFPGRFGNPQFTVGMDGLFFLSKGPEDKFFITPGFGTFVSSTDGGFKNEVGQAKAAVAIGDNPMKFLKSEKADERLMAASMLITKYRQNVHPKAEPIDAGESKLILAALAKADWNMQQDGRQNHPWMLFSQLGLTKKDGWEQPQNIRDVRDLYKAAQTWLEKNGDTYRIVKNDGKQGGGRPVRPPIRIDPPIQIQPLPIQIQPLPAPMPIQGRPGIQIRPGIRIQPAQPPQVEPAQDLPAR